MKVDGACHCGRIAYEAQVDPSQVAICHCADCQTLSGSAFRVLAYVAESDFHLLKGNPKVYVKVAESGRRRLQLFCGECGTSVCSTGEESPKTYALRVGTLRQRADLVPKVQYWCRSALSWVPDIENTSRHSMQ